MGCGGSKPEVAEEPKPAFQPVVSEPVLVSETTKTATPGVESAEAISILPAGGPAPVAILPPWVTHSDIGEVVGSRRPSNASTGATGANDPAANALRSNLSEVRSGEYRAPRPAVATQAMTLPPIGWDCRAGLIIAVCVVVRQALSSHLRTTSGCQSSAITLIQPLGFAVFIAR